MAASTKQIEDYLQKIRRLPSNKLCANCRVPSRLGFSAVCVKYQSFVCDMCKSSHQSYSHRTKSVTMSTWTLDEVKALDEKNGGGNDWCRARWFAKMSDAEQAKYMPKEGEPLDNYKRFVHMAYEQSKWYDENGRPATASVSSGSEPKPATSPAKKATPALRMSPSPTKSQSKPADEDLLILDFDAKVTVTPPVSGSTPMTQAAAIAADSDDWGSFNAPESSNTKPAPARVSLGNDDDWSFQSAPAAASTGPASASQNIFNPLGAGASAPASAPQSSFDPFAALYSKPPQAALNMPQPQQPYGFPGGLPPAAPTVNMAPGAFPRTGVSAQPQAPSPQMMMMGGFAPAQKPAGMAEDPFSHLHSYNSAPAAMGRAVSAGNAPNPAPVGNLARASSTGNVPANDPFAGLF